MITKNKTATQYKKALRELTEAVQAFENALDIEMKKPSTFERGKRIAALMNRLQIANHAAMHFTLGYSFQKINKLAQPDATETH